ncbi:hypothetical protein BDQ94DRAFT_134756 [Aspergillus welwitschiae]|uniref:Uncharacterized protein n=1 Tax=Aspergillus welwitschiae TaxID=1341132 RepID=A0A3F3QIE7_9EURO|nr:hypothetical protein BDQ94DRAFT_134756 [Aspergillus welwitschiae]RDH38850.1 hypothetical protein BDQ94DRAFT_134756 [Aspergillus welwitschiae]
MARLGCHAPSQCVTHTHTHTAWLSVHVLVQFPSSQRERKSPSRHYRMMAGSRCRSSGISQREAAHWPAHPPIHPSGVSTLLSAAMAFFLAC